MLTIFTVCSMYKIATGKGAVSGRAEVVYDNPDDLQLQEYRPRNDGDIKLKGYPAYEKFTASDIELEECPAYVKKKKDQAIELEECPPYLEKKKDQSIKLEEYVQLMDTYEL